MHQYRQSQHPPGPSDHRQQEPGPSSQSAQLPGTAAWPNQQPAPSQFVRRPQEQEDFQEQEEPDTSDMIGVVKIKDGLFICDEFGAQVGANNNFRTLSLWSRTK